MTIIKTIMAVTLLLFAGLAQSANITKTLEFVVQDISSGANEPNAPEIGQIFLGQLIYDDADLTFEQNGASSLSNNQFDLQLVFNGFDFAINPAVTDFANFSSTGALVNLGFTVDFPNALFFLAPDASGAMTFNFDLQKIPPGEEIGQTFARGSGIIREPLVQTPLPGAAWLFLSGLGVLSRSRRPAN